MSLTGTATDSLVVTDYGTLLSFDGDTFDANQIGYPTVVSANGVYSLYYAGLAFSNEKELGLATSTDGENFIRYSNDPIVASSDEPGFASFRILPATVLFEDGLYKMWFFGSDSNSLADTGQTTAWGYGTSVDGVNWTFDDTPIRSETGPYAGDQLIEVVKLGSQYMAFYRDINGSDYAQTTRYYVAYSTDGIHFSGDTEFDEPGGFELLAATASGGKVISVWTDGQDFYTANSVDGVTFTRVTQLDVPDFLTIYDLTISGGTVTVWCERYEGPGSWGSGTTTIGSFTLALSAFLGTTAPLDNPILFNGGNGSDTIMGGNNNDTLSGGNGNDSVNGGDGNDALTGGNGEDALYGGIGNNSVGGGNGQDLINGGEGNDSLTGDNGNDTLYGGSGNDLLFGGNGADKFDGNSGNDTISGGNGADIFVFKAGDTTGAHDTIVDWDNADSIVLSGFGAVTATNIHRTQSGSDVIVTVQVLDGSGSPIAGAVLELTLLNETLGSVHLSAFSFI